MSTGSLAELARLSRLLDLIYEGTTEPQRWDSILPAIAEWLGAPRGWLFTPWHIPENGGFCFTHAFAPSMISMWRDKWHAHDRWAFRAMELGKFVEGNVFRGDELISEEEIMSAEVYKEFMLPHRMHHLLSGLVFGTTSPGMMPTACSFFRGPDEIRFTAEDSGKMSLLLPHISRSLGVMQRLRDADLKLAASLAALDKLSVGVLLIGEARSVVFANRAARRVLQREDGLQLRTAARDQTFLAARASKVQENIDAAIRQCVEPDVVDVSHFSQAVRIDRPSGLPAYLLNFSALPEHNEFGSGADHPRAIGFLNDPDEPVNVNAEVLHRLYGLTAAECRLAARLCDGDTLSAIARQLGIRETTVKTQLRSIFEKTRTRRQVQLVKLLVSLASS